MARNCNCGSDNMKSLKAISEQLNIKSSSTTVGGGFFGGRGGVGAAKSYGNMSPELVKKIQNRIPHKTGIFNIIWGLLLTFLSLVLMAAMSEDGEDIKFFIGLFFFFVLVVIVKIVGRFRYRKKYDHYRRTWYCFSCGNFWVYKERVKGTT